MRGVLLGLAVVLALAQALTLVAADHVYSHRFVLEGRLLGSDGLPLPGREVRFIHEGDSFTQPCASAPHAPVTDEWGDFRFCFHKHQLSTRTMAGVEVGNVSTLRPMDTAFRRTVVVLEEPNDTGVAPEGWERTYRVAGRAWQPIVTTLEGVQVYGIAVENLTVNLTIATPTGNRTMQDVTDATGDFDFVVELGPDEPFEDVTVRLEALGRGQPVKLDARSHRTTAPVYVAANRTGDEVRVNFPDASTPAPAQPMGPRVQAPGGTPPVSPGLIMATLLAFVGVAWLTQKRL